MAEAARLQTSVAVGGLQEWQPFVPDILACIAHEPWFTLAGFWASAPEDAQSWDPFGTMHFAFNWSRVEDAGFEVTAPAAYREVSSAVCICKH